MNKMIKDFLRGLWDEHPTFRIMIGMCPTLAVTTAAINGFGMAVATTFVLVCSSILISVLKKVIPGELESLLISLSLRPLLQPSIISCRLSRQISTSHWEYLFH